MDTLLVTNTTASLRSSLKSKKATIFVIRTEYSETIQPPLPPESSSSLPINTYLNGNTDNTQWQSGLSQGTG